MVRRVRLAARGWSMVGGGQGCGWRWRGAAAVEDLCHAVAGVGGRVVAAAEVGPQVVGGGLLLAALAATCHTAARPPPPWGPPRYTRGLSAPEASTALGECKTKLIWIWASRGSPGAT